MQEQTLERISKIGNYPYFTKNSTELKYFINYTGSNGYLLVLNAKQFIFYTDSRYIETCRKSIGKDAVKLLENIYIHPLDTILQDIKIYKLSQLFLDFHLFTHQEILDLKKDTLAMNLELLSLPVAIDRIRIVKDKSEVEKVRRAQEINEKAFAAIIGLLKEGVSERDITAEYEYIIKKQGASGTSFNPIFVFGANSSFPHGVPSDNKLKKGDVVLLDAGVLYDSYCSDMTRTLSFGEPRDTSFKTNYQILLQAQKDCINMIAEVTEYAELDAFVREQLKPHKLDQLFQHSLGHGVGIDIHEVPRIFHQKTGEPIKKGHIFTIEPGIYLEGQYGIRIEDMIYMKNDKQAELISEFPKDLLIL